MKRFIAFISVLTLCFATACSSDEDTSSKNPDETPTETTLYFPPNSGEWEQVSPESLGWDLTKEDELIELLTETNTKAFIILKNGKIAFEKYFGTTTESSNLPWYSAAKTLVASCVGIAQQENLLSINDASSLYLGEGWTSETPEQEAAISIRNQLTMTTGVDYTVENTYCTDPDCLLYLNNPGTYWFYHNATYTLLHNVIAEATQQDMNSFLAEKIGNPIGMNGQFVSIGYLEVYYSTARSMARFGLLNLNRGKWNETQLIPENYALEMTSTSQTLNPAYGYLWWLNGKESFKLPQSTQSFPGKLIPSAPNDLFAGLGADDKKLYVVPSEQLVVVRLGESANEALAGPSSYDEELWQKLNAFMNL